VKQYPRKLLTSAGEVDLEVPKLRTLTFETAIIQRYQRRETSIEEALVEMYLAGVSTRRIEDITDLLLDAKLSAGTVSRLNGKVYEQIEYGGKDLWKGNTLMFIWMVCIQSAIGVGITGMWLFW